MVVAVEKTKGNGDNAEQKLLEKNYLELVPKGANRIIGEKSPNNEKIPDGKDSANDKFTIGPAGKRDYDLVPPDGKWGWFVLAGAMTSNILIPGSIKSSGVLLVEFREVFNASPSVSSAIVALCYFLYFCLGPVSSILSARWSFRTVVLLGASFGSLGMILSSFATSIYYLYVSFGVMLGIGAGLSVPANIYIVTTYFQRLRGVANGICISGSVFGSIMLPPLIQYLVETYGYKGAVLIQGGIMLNACAAGLLLQPVKRHMIKKYKEPDDGEDQLLYEEKENETNEPTARLTSTDETIDSEKIQLTRENAPHEPTDVHSLSEHPLRNSLIRRSSRETNGRRLSHEGPRRSISATSIGYTSTSIYGTPITDMEEPETHTCVAVDKSTTEDKYKEVTCCFCCKRMENKNKEKSKHFDITLLKDPIFLIILVSSSVIPISYTNFIILLPSHVQNIGFGKAKGAYLLSTVCACELAGRLGGSAICDLKLVPPPVYFAGGLLFAGITQATIPFLDSYTAISILCGLFGFSTGVTCGSQTLVMTEVLGLEKLMTGFGITLFFSGLIQLSGPTICGLWFEHDKNFFNMFLTFGVVYIIGATSWLFLPMLNKRKNAQVRTKNQTAHKV